MAPFDHFFPKTLMTLLTLDTLDTCLDNYR